MNRDRYTRHLSDVRSSRALKIIINSHFIGEISGFLLRKIRFHLKKPTADLNMLQLTETYEGRCKF